MKEQLKALNLVHVSLLITLILDSILCICLYYLYLPSAFRYCICSGLISVIPTAEIVFFLVYRPLAFACLSVLQFFTIIGKKMFVNLKLTCGVVALCIAISFICVVIAGRQLYLAGWRSICGGSFCPDSGPGTAFVVLKVIVLSLSLVILLPSLAVVIIMSTWSCIVFKKYYTGGDNQLNPRVLSLPFIIPTGPPALADVHLHRMHVLIDTLSLISSNLIFLAGYSENCTF